MAARRAYAKQQNIPNKKNQTFLRNIFRSGNRGGVLPECTKKKSANGLLTGRSAHSFQFLTNV
jgi:hypothetical protein